MSLTDYQIIRERIPLPGKAVDGVKPGFDVRGLTLEDMTFLLQNHLGPITRAVKLYQESREDIIASGNLSSFLLSLTRDFPALAAEVISAAADELNETAIAKARQLPIPTQIMAITKIVQLTTEEAGGLKNLLAEMQSRITASVESSSAAARPE